MITRSADPNYVWGAAVAAWSLRKLSDHQIHFLVTQSVDAAARRFLAQFGNGLIEKSPIQHPSIHKGRFQDNYTKLHVFDLAGFDRIVYLDADTLPLQNFDDLFDLSSALAATHDFGRGIDEYFNAGVISLRPDPKLFKRLMDACQRDPRDWGCAEQDFLNWWFGPKPRWLRPARLLEFLRRAGIRNWQAIGYEYNAIHLAERIAAGYDPGKVRLVHEKLWEDHGLPEFEHRWQTAKTELVRDLESRGGYVYEPR
jgi:alpha-N-acetylglucosamine transferase